MVKNSDFWAKRIRTPRTISAMRGVGGSSVLTQLLVANYEPTTKSIDDWLCPLDEADFEKPTQLLKGVDPNDERYVMGIVLEPEVVDAQGDIYSVDEIREAAHRFMEEFGGLGLMHRMRVNGQVKVLESYLAPTDFTVGDVNVRRGTWMLAVRILSDDLWERVKGGDLTGFSIGGTARRQPEPTSAATPPSTAGGTPPSPEAPDAQPQPEAA
jgi:DNA adenine methylase